MAADGIDECGWATDVQISCRCPSWGRLAAPALVKLPSRAPSGARALDSFWAAQCALHFHHLVPPFAGIGPAASKSLRHVFQGRTAAPCAAKSSPGGCSVNALDNQPAEPAGTALELPQVVAKCSVMVGGHQVSSGRLLGRPGPKSGRAGSRWRPQHIRKFRAARAACAMTPVLQDKTLHSIDLAELPPADILHRKSLHQ